jgi:hypothetical protein
MERKTCCRIFPSESTHPQQRNDSSPNTISVNYIVMSTIFLLSARIMLIVYSLIVSRSTACNIEISIITVNHKDTLGLAYLSFVVKLSTSEVLCSKMFCFVFSEYYVLYRGEI